MNSDASTYEVPEYILSRMINIYVDFPNPADELKILQYNLPFASEEVLDYCVNFLKNAHTHNEPIVSRDGIKCLRYYIKQRQLNGKDTTKLEKKEFKDSILHILDKKAIRYCPDEYEKYLEEMKKKMEKERNKAENIIHGTFFPSDNPNNI
jgi:hypothetical protein